MTTITDNLVGWHPAMPEAEYHAIEAASSHRLGALLRSPAHCWQIINNAIEPTAAMILGRALHSAVLEPMLFAGRFVVADFCCETKRDGAECDNPGKVISGGKWYCGVHAKGRSPDNDARAILNQTDMDCVMAMRDSVMANPDARALLDAEGPIEASGFFIEPESGQLCKIRPDKIALKFGTTVDLKKTDDASPDAFVRSTKKFGYHRQGALYQYGAACLGIRIRRHAVIAVEDSPPYVSTVRCIGERTLAGAWGEMLTAIRRYRECRESGEWPGYEDASDIELPEYDLRKLGV